MTRDGGSALALIFALFAMLSHASAESAQTRTEHHVVVTPDSPALAYTTEAAFLTVPGRDAGSTASMFYIAYASPSAEQQRPIVFAYNGGPGGSSAGVHIGAFGPRVVAAVEPGHLDQATDLLVDNPDTLLREADLVFIDPVGSGLSRLSPGAKPQSFYGVNQDAAATAAFVAAYLRQHDEMGRPFFVMGESYGTMRTVLAARLLQEQGFRPAGLILMSLILDNATLFAQSGDDEPFWLFLPSEAATARYQNKAETGTSFDVVMASAKQFAEDRYMVALARGSDLSVDETRLVTTRLTTFLGFKPDDVRIPPDLFAQSLLGSGRLVSRADGRFSGVGRGSGPLGDPLYAVMLPLYGRAMTRYLRDEVGVTTSADYRVLDTGVADAWQWGETTLGSPTALSVGDKLGEALRVDPHLGVFVASGVYDLTSPVLATDYTLAHLNVDRDERARITNHRYDSGHMIYVSADSRHRLTRDIVEFIRSGGRK